MKNLYMYKHGAKTMTFPEHILIALAKAMGEYMNADRRKLSEMIIGMTKDDMHNLSPEQLFDYMNLHELLPLRVILVAFITRLQSTMRYYVSDDVFAAVREHAYNWDKRTIINTKKTAVVPHVGIVYNRPSKSDTKCPFRSKPVLVALSKFNWQINELDYGKGLAAAILHGQVREDGSYPVNIDLVSGNVLKATSAKLINSMKVEGGSSTSIVSRMADMDLARDVTDDAHGKFSVDDEEPPAAKVNIFSGMNAPPLRPARKS